ncbi:trehalose-phosphatase [Methanobacterium subterraneum]|uniref:trehalose-phosphatase n=1 Tax=Methanobacterium subterraneum TaxID=59277 RepID=UPI001F01CB25|nr:trehalose-phosphatase [Methanobacterium subterraneum]
MKGSGSVTKYLFDNLKHLETFKYDSSTAIVTDIDGTISEIAPTPTEALVTDSMREELVKLHRKFSLVAVVSGRSVLNAREMVDVDGLLYVGNHGMEFLENGKISLYPEVEKYLPQMKQAGQKLQKGDLSHIDGLLFEDKGICFSVHYRLASQSENVRGKILHNIKNDPDCEKLKISEGRQLVELKPPLSCDKGTILENIIQEYNLKKIIYLGDDITDLDAFKRLKVLENQGELRGAGVLVCSSEIPHDVKKGSSYYVNGVDEVLKFFQWLSN